MNHEPDLMRSELHKLAERASITDLTARAHARATEIRRRRAGAVAALAVVAAVGIIGGANQVLGSQDRLPPEGTPTSTPSAAPSEPAVLDGTVRFELTTESDGHQVLTAMVGESPELVLATENGGRVSPDNTLSAYVRSPSPDTTYLELWVSRIDGSSARQLGYVRAQDRQWFAWSPDSTRLAVSDLHEVDPQTEEFVRGLGPALVPVDGSAPTVLSSGYTGGVSPVWSPDGSHVAFAEGTGHDQTYAPQQVVVAPTDAPTETTSAAVPSNYDVQSVSDDGTRVLLNDVSSGNPSAVLDVLAGEVIEPDLGPGVWFTNFLGSTTAAAVRNDSPTLGEYTLVLVRVPANPTAENVIVLDEAPMPVPLGWAGTAVTFRATGTQ